METAPRMRPAHQIVTLEIDIVSKLNHVQEFMVLMTM